MAKNKMSDLRDHLFETLEALKDTEKPMDLDRAKAILETATPRTISSTAFCTTVEMFWAQRPCWMCGESGPCGHREYEVALAYVAASQKGIRR